MFSILNGWQVVISKISIYMSFIDMLSTKQPEKKIVVTSTIEKSLVIYFSPAGCMYCRVILKLDRPNIVFEDKDQQ